MIHLLHIRRHLPTVWLLCIALAALFDFLFWGQSIGCSAAVFAAALAGTLVWGSPNIWTSWLGRVTLLLTSCSILALVEEPSINAFLIATISLLTLVLVSQRDLDLLTENVSAWFLKYFTLAAMLWMRIFTDNVLIVRWLARHPRLNRRLLSFLTFFAWWILPLLVGTLFIGLFSLANPVIAQFLSHLQSYLAHLFNWLITLEFLRLFIWSIVIVFSYGILRHRHTWRRSSITPPPILTPPTFAWLTGPQMIVRLLIVLNIIFAFENILDAQYLYGGTPLPPGLSYKQYAHRGAYTLIATALLAGIFTLVSFRHRGTAHRSRACRWLVYLWILQNILLLISTIWRVCIYVDTYYLTRLRVATMIWSALVAAGFLWIILRIMFNKPNAWLWRMNAFSTILVLTTCAFINFDGIIADFNVRHCAETGGTGTNIEFDYIASFGTASLPALTWYHDHARLTDEEFAKVDQTTAKLHAQLESELSDWRSWTYRRSRNQRAETAIALVRR